MQKPTQAALDAFDASFPDDSRGERRKMFGMPAGFVHGNMFLGVFGDGVVLRLPADALAEAVCIEGVENFEPMPGRPWKAYAHAPSSLPAERLASWAQTAFDHTAAMPPKLPKPRRAKKKA